MKRIFSFFPTAFAGIIGAALLSSCSSHTATGTGIGAAVGGGIGALATGTPEGAIIGAGIGSGIGALAGNAIDKRSQRYQDQNVGYGQGDITQEPVREQAPPWGKQRAPGVAISPYPPHRDIDIRGYKRGEAVIDPTTGGVFLVP